MLCSPPPLKPAGEKNGSAAITSTATSIYLASLPSSLVQECCVWGVACSLEIVARSIGSGHRSCRKRRRGVGVCVCGWYSLLASRVCRVSRVCGLGLAHGYEPIRCRDLFNSNSPINVNDLLG
ncbi:hypothetical protein Hanom_Chr00s110659g01807541 [Helianthus anomalus]